MSARTFFTRMNFYLIYAIEYLPLRIFYAFYDPNVTRKEKGEKMLSITAIGDSITAGMCSNSLCLASKDNFAAYLSEKLDADLVNLSYPFAISRDVRKQAEKAPESDIITVFVGANDAILGRDISEYRENLTKIIEIAKQKAKMVVVIGLPNFSFVKNAQSRRCKVTRSVLFPLALIVNDPDVEKRFEQFNSEIRRIAAEQGVHFIDVHKIDFGDKELGKDCFHPGPLGQQKIAEEVYKAMLGKKG